jgi:hypothetical protein
MTRYHAHFVRSISVVRYLECNLAIVAGPPGKWASAFRHRRPSTASEVRGTNERSTIEAEGFCTQQSAKNKLPVSKRLAMTDRILILLVLTKLVVFIQTAERKLRGIAGE